MPVSVVASDMKKKVFAALVGIATILMCVGNALAQASVITDQMDYPPGSTVYISGAGFQPGETVQVQVLRIDIDETPARSTTRGRSRRTPTAISRRTWYVTLDEAGATLQLTATGLTSGLVAQMTFTDTATVTAATGGSAISADTTGGTYTTLTGPVLTEGANRTFPLPAPSFLTHPVAFNLIQALP